jgi:hypothetical protein
MFNEVKEMLKDARRIERKVRFRAIGAARQVLTEASDLMYDLQREITRKL